MTCRELFKTLIRLSCQHDYCWPSLSYLAEAIGVTPRTLQNQLALLGQLGLLRVHRRPGQSSLYQVSPEVMEFVRSTASGTTNPRKVFQGAARGTAARTHEKFSGTHEKFSPVLFNTEKGSKITPLPPVAPDTDSSPQRQQGGEGGSSPASGKPHQRSQAHADFERLWQAWPVKQGRDPALRSYLTLRRCRRLPDIDSLLATVATMATTDSRWKRGKVSLLSRWLREGRWTDQPYVEPPSGQCADGWAPPSPSGASSRQVLDVESAARQAVQSTVSSSLFQRIWSLWGNTTGLPHALGCWHRMDTAQRDAVYQQALHFISTTPDGSRQSLGEWLRETMERRIAHERHIAA